MSDIRIIEHEGRKLKVVSVSVDHRTEDRIVHARALVRCRYDRGTLRVTSSTWSNRLVRLVNPVGKTETVPFTKDVAKSLMIKVGARRQVASGEAFKAGLKHLLGSADPYTARLVAKALAPRQAFELRCFAVATDLGLDYQSASASEREAIEALAEESR